MMDQEGRSPWPRYDQSQRNNRSSNTNGYGRLVAFPRGVTGMVKWDLRPVTADYLIGSQDFPKSACFSPDGLCILTTSEEDHILRVYEVPDDYDGCVNNEGGDNNPNGPVNEYTTANYHDTTLKDGGSCSWGQWKPSVVSKEPERVYKAVWFPHMDSGDPATCCFASTSRDNPIHLWDAFTGDLRCNYTAYNDSDEIVAAKTLCFSPNGAKLYGGFERSIKGWDITTPGKEATEFRISRTRHSKGCQRGCICSMAFDTDGNILAAGSFERSLWLYDIRVAEPIGAMSLPQGAGAPMNLMWSRDGWRLYMGGRRDTTICCWDVRRGGIDDCIISSFPRKATTNQCIGFDLDMDGSLLVTGGTDGIVHAYNAITAEELGQRHFPHVDDEDEESVEGCNSNSNGDQIFGRLRLYRITAV